jgi:iron complex transport system ATP-binding protein
MKAAGMNAPILEASGLSIGWGRGAHRHALSGGIELSASLGRLIALVGPNGSGKSTLLRTLAGFQAPLAGTLKLGGDSLGALDAETRARRVACVFNERLETGYFSVADIVAFGRYPYTDARNRLSEGDERHVLEALSAVGMEGFSRQAYAELSDGEKQKVNVARAIAQDAPVLVLDEPTAFLDAPSRIEIFHLAATLAHEAGKCVILSTHELDLALKSADDMWIFDREHRFSAGTPYEIAHSGAIGRAFASPNLSFDPALGVFRVEKS